MASCESLKLRQVLNMQAEAIRQTGDIYARTKLTPFVKRLFVKLLKWRRS